MENTYVPNVPNVQPFDKLITTPNCKKLLLAGGNVHLHYCNEHRSRLRIVYLNIKSLSTLY